MKLKMALAVGSLCMPIWAQNTTPDQETKVSSQQMATQETVDRLTAELTAAMARIKALEEKTGTSTASAAAAPVTAAVAPNEGPPPAVPPTVAPPPAPEPEPAPPAEDMAEHDHMMQIPGGPQLTIKGFADVNLNIGQNANSLIFPYPVKAHDGFNLGEFDLFLGSKLSPSLKFVSEVVIGADTTNYWGLDIERLQLTYRPSEGKGEYFEISAGRYHTAIGYYNTAFHHGNWFSTATGRPFMYFFEDSGGILPVHNVGVTTTGLVPKTGRLRLHWVAEIGNGRSSSNLGQPVQNFATDRDFRATNFAVYAKPEWVPGLQVGGSWYHDIVTPLSIPKITQQIESAYAVYQNSGWEFLNEAVLLTNQYRNTQVYFHTPMAYTQFAKAFGKYKPYFRYQYLNSPNNDPINVYTGRYQGPSVGLRYDIAAFMALKFQFNRLYQRQTLPENGFDVQMAFTF